MAQRSKGLRADAAHPRVEVPFERTQLLPTGESVTRRQGRLLNIRFPLDFHFVPQGTYYKQARLDNYTINGNGLPFDIYTEHWYEYREQRQALTQKQAEQSAMAQLSLYEAFGLANAEIKDRQIKKTVTKRASRLRPHIHALRISATRRPSE